MQSTTKKTNQSDRERDQMILQNLSDREAVIADAATRLAFDKAGDWLANKQSKAELFPGGDLVHAKGREAAYQNASQEMYGWALAHRREDV